MEAASARMAARDRYAGFDTPANSPLQRFIQNACDPQNFEPNLALNLEISDMINSKKGPAPREAAISIVGHVNNRNPNISLLALTLLDICVKNCGYPFHLQISTKEFLNELVRRFPERPPMRYSRVQNKILELIEEWRSTICETSKYKDDLGFIRDMHRLLSYKGYTFPAVKREDAAVLNPTERLQSAEEMEEEERAAQSAKLQELIRRGTPHDLQEANKLMKVMAGFDNRSKTDYRAKAAEEVAKVQQKAKLLEDMLQRHKPGDQGINADSFEDLANALASAHPRIQKMCEEESEDHEAVAKLLEINDSIHRTLQRYKLMKAGDITAAEQIPKGTLGTSGAGVSKGRGADLDLIDFGGPEEAQTTHAANASSASSAGPAPDTQQGSSLENDLLGLSLENGGGNGGQISLGGGNLSSLMANYPGSQPQPSPSVFASSAASAFPAQQAPRPSPSAAGTAFHSTAPFQTSVADTTPQVRSQPVDPFAALSTSAHASRTSSPFPSSQSSVRQAPQQSSATNSLAALSRTGTPGGSQSAFAAPPQAPQSNGPADDEWTFASALPDQAHEVTVSNTNVNTIFLVSRPPSSPNEILIKASVSNNTAQQVSDFTFQLAVVRTLQLRLEPQSGRALQPHQRGGITQVIHLHGVEPGRGSNVKVRWKMSYYVGGQKCDEQGEVASLGIS